MRDWAWDPGPLGKFVSSEEFRESIDCCIETIEVQEKLVNLSVDLPSYEKNKCDYQQLMNKNAATADILIAQYLTHFFVFNLIITSFIILSWFII